MLGKKLSTSVSTDIALKNEIHLWLIESLDVVCMFGVTAACSKNITIFVSLNILLNYCDASMSTNQMENEKALLPFVLFK